MGMCRVDKQLRRVVYCAGVRAGNERDWDYMWSKLEIEAIAAERSYLLSGLACAQQPELINRCVCRPFPPIVTLMISIQIFERSTKAHNHTIERSEHHVRKSRNIQSECAHTIIVAVPTAALAKAISKRARNAYIDGHFQGGDKRVSYARSTR
jgi:hypothetical protein